MTTPKDPVSMTTEAPAAERIDTELVRELAAILNDTDLTEIEVERGDLRIRVARETAAPGCAGRRARPRSRSGRCR